MATVAILIPIQAAKENPGRISIISMIRSALSEHHCGYKVRAHRRESRVHDGDENFPPHQVLLQWAGRGPRYILDEQCVPLGHSLLVTPIGIIVLMAQ